MLNEAARIDAALHALAPLRHRGCEVIVVDGGSTDGTPERAQSLADQVLTAPRGRANQQNAGAYAAQHDLLLFLHADTELPEGADSLIGEAIARGAAWGRFDVVFGDAGRPQASPARTLAVVATMMNWRSRVSGIATGDQCIFVRRDAFLRVGGFPMQPLMEDIELSRQLKRVSAPACLTALVTTSPRRWLAYGVWRTIALMWWLRLAYWLGVSPQRLACWYGY